MAVISDIAEAIVAALNSVSFSQSCTATRGYLPEFDLEEMQTLRVTVVPKAVRIAAGDRGKNAHDYDIDIAVQKKLSDADNDEIDALMGLVEEIADFFRLKRLAGYTNAVWINAEHEPIYATEHLQELRQFTSVLTLTFRVMR